MHHSIRNNSIWWIGCGSWLFSLWLPAQRSPNKSQEFVVVCNDKSLWCRLSSFPHAVEQPLNSIHNYLFIGVWFSLNWNYQISRRASWIERKTINFSWNLFPWADTIRTNSDDFTIKNVRQNGKSIRTSWHNTKNTFSRVNYSWILLWIEMPCVSHYFAQMAPIIIFMQHLKLSLCISISAA